ncbi:MAG: FAD-dependent oxidoreductase, partial [Lentisphaerae bacterium]|nr:FAD-dependent oxidoreductase [Lentisphaerota bacterium]
TELTQRMRSQAERFGARVRSGEVTGCDFSGNPLLLRLDDGEELTARAVIIATGASAIYLGLESEQKLIGRGVSGCATCDGALYRNVPVAVLGGGDTAMEDALFLTRFASRVTVIHRRDQFRASKIMADRVLQHPKIDVVWDSVVTEVLDVERGEVTAPFAGQLEMDDKGYIRAVNTRTAVKGVFAAGDVTDHVYRQAVTAAGSGCMAALEVERYLSG